MVKARTGVPPDSVCFHSRCHASRRAPGIGPWASIFNDGTPGTRTATIPSGSAAALRTATPTTWV